MDLSTLISRTSPFPILGVLGGVHFFQILIEHPEANSEDPDQSPHYAVSGLDLHCLHMPNKMVAMLTYMSHGMRFPTM